jgi:hypothetical protein
MPLDVKKVMTYSQPFEEVYKAAYLTVQELGGKVIKHDLGSKQLFGQMDKKFKEDFWRPQPMEMTFSQDADGNTVLMYAYLLNAIGVINVRCVSGVVETVLEGFS